MFYYFLRALTISAKKPIVDVRLGFSPFLGHTCVCLTYIVLFEKSLESFCDFRNKVVFTTSIIDVLQNIFLLWKSDKCKCCPGYNLETIGRVRKFLKEAFKHKTQKCNSKLLNLSKKAFFSLEIEKVNVRYLDAKLS